MGFQFIDNSTINRGSRRLIRSHVMKGKNAGRSLKHARKPRSTASDALAATRIAPLRLIDNVLSDIRHGQVSKDLDKTALAIRDWVWNGFLYFSFPMKLTPQVTYLLHSLFGGVGDALYPPEFCLQIDLMKSLWLQYMLEDEAVFHSMLAITAAMIDFFLAREEVSPAVLTHLSQTFTLVNQKLSSNEATSDTSLAVVVLLIIYEQLRRDEDRMQVHFEGLRRMVNLRGGLIALGHNCSLVQKICRADIEFALRSGSTTNFSWNEIPEESMLSILPSWVKNHRDIPRQFETVPAELQQIIMEIFQLTDCLNNNSFSPRLEPFSYQATLLSFWYRLIPYRPLNDTGSVDLIEDAVHLGMISFMITTLLQFGRRKILAYPFVAERMKGTLARLLSNTSADKALTIWLFFVGGLSVLDKKDQEWAAGNIRKIAHEMGINSWVRVRELLGRFPWINTLHDESARALWKSAPIGAESCTQKDVKTITTEDYNTDTLSFL